MNENFPGYCSGGSNPAPTPTQPPTQPTPTPKADGQACSSNNECQSFYCNPQGVCAQAPATEQCSMEVNVIPECEGPNCQKRTLQGKWLDYALINYGQTVNQFYGEQDNYISPGETLVFCARVDFSRRPDGSRACTGVGCPNCEQYGWCPTDDPSTPNVDETKPRKVYFEYAENSSQSCGAARILKVEPPAGFGLVPRSNNTWSHFGNTNYNDDYTDGWTPRPEWRAEPGLYKWAIGVRSTSSLSQCNWFKVSWKPYFERAN